MALKFADFKTHVRLLTRENTASGTYRYASDANCLLAWSLVIPEINMLTHSNMVSNVSSPILSVANQALYDIPTHTTSGEPMQDILEVYYNGKPLTLLSLTEARMSSGIGNPWWNRPGDPIRFLEENGKIHLYPVPPISNVPIQVWGFSGIKQPTSSTDSTTTSQVDGRLDKCIIYAGCEYIANIRHEDDMASKYLALKKEALREYQEVQVDRHMRGSTQFLDVDPHEKF